MKWFDRNFSFEHLIGTLPSILERLKGTPVRLKNKIEVIPQDFYRTKIDGSWSIQEQVGHLDDLESLWEARFIDFIKSRETLTAADLTNQKTHLADHNQDSMARLLESFESKRLRLCDRIANLSDQAESISSKHPRLGTPMRPIDLAFFIAEHDDHHLAGISQIERLLSKKNQ